MRLAFAFLLLAPVMAFAQEVTLKKITSDHSKFSGTGSGIQVGQTYSLNSDSSVCSAVVLKANSRSGIFKVTSCDDKDALKVGDLFVLVGGGEVTSFDGLTPKKPVSGLSKFGHRVGAGLVYSTADRTVYNRTTGTLSGSAQENASATFGVDGTYHWFRPTNVGVSGRLTYELARDFKTIKVSGNTSDNPEKLKLSMAILEVSANFILEMGAYAYAGINYPYMITDSVSTKMSGGLGYQAGGGYLITREIGVDLQVRLLRANGSFKNGLVDGSMNDIKMDGLLLTGTYYFYDF